MNVRRRPAVYAALGALLGTALPVCAQVPWESPQMNAPGSPRGVSLMYVDHGLRPFDGTGIMLLYRTAEAPRSVALRIASTIPGSDRARISGGVDLGRPLFRRTPAFPLDVHAFAGIGSAYGDYLSVAVPAGLSAARSFDGSAVRFAPWTGARVVVERAFGEDRPNDNLEIAVAAELGTDLWLRGADAVRLRAAVSLGDRRAFALGLHLRRRAAPAVTARRD